MRPGLNLHLDHRERVLHHPRAVYRFPEADRPVRRQHDLLSAVLAKLLLGVMEVIRQLQLDLVRE